MRRGGGLEPAGPFLLPSVVPRAHIPDGALITASHFLTNGL